MILGVMVAHSLYHDVALGNEESSPSINAS